jgi:hypothetical protein
MFIVPAFWGPKAYLVKFADPDDLVALLKIAKDSGLTRNRMPENSWNILDAGELGGKVKGPQR